MECINFKEVENSIENFNKIKKSKIPQRIPVVSSKICGIQISSANLPNDLNQSKSFKPPSKIPQLIRSSLTNKKFVTGFKSLKPVKNHRQTSIPKKSASIAASYDMYSLFKPKYHNISQNHRKSFSKFTLVTTDVQISEDEHENSLTNKTIYPKEDMENYYCMVPIIYRLRKRRVIMELKSIFSMEKRFDPGRLEDDCDNILLVKNIPEELEYREKHVSNITNNGNSCSVLRHFHRNCTKDYFPPLLSRKNREKCGCGTCNQTKKYYEGR
ncbi:hypothetical protein TNIN_150651 [Trichonephila inaurata madagascariensis]|uniref:Uncharacterized protein n=1 Tax=Trichonephila inaurata madagascariensis TaxID=2747483 RepID=A0A8X6IKL9_9ARAC|nr:hypothetical protein TNIN_150651 [Trichonephila inaurata madagascariensis]